MKINRETFVEAVASALTAERDGAQKMEPCIGFYRNGNEIVCRYESALTPSDRIHFLSWDAQGWGINDRVASLSDAQISENAEATFDIWKDEIIEDLLDVLNDEY